MKNLLPLQHICILLFVFLFVLPSCKKNDQNDFTVENYNGTTDVHVMIYGSEEDYINATNPIIQGIAPAKNTFTFSSSALKPGTWYYVDAYSNDYTITNWAESDGLNIGTDSTTPRRFKYNAGDKDFVLVLTQTNARKVLLKNTGTGSKWRAIDAIDLADGSDIWSSLPAKEHYKELVVNKNHTGYYRFLSGADTAVTQFSFSNDVMVSYPTFTLLPDQTSLLMFISNTYVNPAISIDEPPTTDSVISLLNGNLYIMVRE